jgi:O-antigen/teichoic acid export membrane protein
MTERGTADGSGMPPADPTATPARPGGELVGTGKLIGASATSLATSIGFFAVNYFTNIVFARILSPEDYGDYAIGMTTLALGGMVAMAGSGHAMLRYLPDYLARQDWARFAGFVRFFIPLAIVAALLIGAAIWAARELFALVPGFGHEDRTLDPIAVAALVIPFYALAVLGGRLLRSFDILLGAFLPMRLLAPLSALALVGALHAAGIVVTDWMVMAAVGAGYALALLFELTVMIWHGHRRLLWHKPVFEIGVWLGAALPMMSAGLLSELLHHSDLIMLEFIAPDEAMVGHYAAVNNTVLILSIVVGSITPVIAPWIGAALGRAAPAQLQELLGRGTALLAVTSGTAMIAIILWRAPILSLFGASFLGATDALTIAALAYGLSGAFGLSRTFLQYLGYHRSALWPMVGAVAVNLVLNGALIPFMGLNGAALATFIALIAMRLAQVVLLYRATGLLVLPFRRRLSARAIGNRKEPG